jgi:hypothetical protein
MGYLSELDGDRETADYYYDKARSANQSSMRVAYATRKDMEGEKLAAVAGASDQAVVKATEVAAAARRAEGGPVVLRYRNNQPVTEPATPPRPPSTNVPRPPDSNPSPAGGDILPPLPDDQQASAQPQPLAPQSAPPTANSGSGLLMPLPDNQQPPAAKEPEPQGQTNGPPQ